MTIGKYFKNLCFFIIRLLFGFKGKKGCTVNILITQTQTLGEAFQVLCTGVHSLSICTVQSMAQCMLDARNQVCGEIADTTGQELLKIL